MSDEKGMKSDNVYRAPSDPDEDIAPPLENPQKSRWERSWPVIACGAGLFSDGYLQQGIGPVYTVFSLKYGDKFTNSIYKNNISAIAFAGTVLGQLVFGYTSDAWSRRHSLLISTIILIVFAALGAGAWGAGGSTTGLFNALTAYRFLLGIGIGGEYPAGSVGCAESTGELKRGHRNRWFVMFTNVQIDLGFLVASLVPIAIAAAQPTNYDLIWRCTLALGVVSPLSLLYLRIKLKDPEAYSRNKFSARTPYWLAFKFYFLRLFVVALIWFIYDFLTYPFGIFASRFITIIAPKQQLWQQFGWAALIDFFYVPGALLGSFTSDWMGPRLALSVFVAAQGIVGFIMAGCYAYLATPQYVAAFVVVYGIFLSLGEMGPGDNIGLVASKTCATGIRGKYYAIAAACGKIGAFIGTYVFPYIEDAGGKDVTLQGQYPFYVASSLCLFSACLVWLLPKIGQDTIEEEDARFRKYLVDHGFDVSSMGNVEWQDKRRASMQRD